MCLQILKENFGSPRILYPVKLSIKYEGRLKIFADVQSFRNYIPFAHLFKNLLEDAFLEKKHE